MKSFKYDVYNQPHNKAYYQIDSNMHHNLHHETRWNTKNNSIDEIFYRVNDQMKESTHAQP